LEALWIQGDARVKNWSTWLFPLTLFAFMGVTIHFVSVVFTVNTRWFFILLLCGQSLLAIHLGNRDRFVVFALSAYLVWCVMTSYWSESVDLSLAKSIAMVIVVFSMVLGGKNWVLRQGEQKALDYLIPTALVGLVAAGMGYFFSPFAYDGELFQGFVYGANMLGSLLGMGLPWFLWVAYVNNRVPRWRFVWGVAPGLVLLFILMSQSRAALLMALFSVGGLVVSLSKRNLLIYICALVLLGSLGAWLRPDYLEEAVQQAVYKHGDEIFYSRKQVWEESWAGAQQGGWLGGGYGVSIGSDSWSQGLTAVGYGREKGSSQLAIIEETGVVGLCLYLSLLVAIGSRIVYAFLHTQNLDLKVSLGVVSGAWFGMHAQAIFEAWWVAPASPESVAFWALTGVGLGLCTLVDRKKSLIARGMDSGAPA